MHYADPAQPLTAAGKRIAEVWNKGRERQEKKERIVREQQARKERNNKNERQRKSKKGQKAARRFVWDVWGCRSVSGVTPGRAAEVATY